MVISMPKWTQEQIDAIEKSGENIIVSAGAGSGKTAVLTERVIQKLKKGIHVHELLILTFTKAAAAEMKERIRKSIKKNPELEEELLFLDRAYITTFDSFSLSVLKKYHYRLGLDKDIAISEESLLSIQKKACLDEVFEELYEEENPLFESMISSFCTKNDEDIKKCVLGMSRKLELRYDLDSYLEDYLSDHYSDFHMQNFLQEYQKRIQEKKQCILEKLNVLESLVDEDYFSVVENYVTPILESDDISTLRTLLSLKFPSLPRGTEEEGKKAKENLVVSLKDLSSFLEYGTLEEMKESIYKTKDTALVICEILKRYFKKIRLYKKENNLYEFTDIAMMAIRVLEENSDICDFLKHSFQEILVDEYQDTNDLQEKFISLIANDNVYMVGDIKQSIYRFRNANPNIFRKKYMDYQNHIGGIKIDLLKNFRSRPEVLEDINTIFRQVMDDEIGGADYISSHQMVFGNNTYIEEGKKDENSKSEIWQYTIKKSQGYSNEEVEAFLVAQDIKRKVDKKYIVFDKDTLQKRPCQYSDFVILMDRTTSFDLYKKIFEYLYIPLTLYKDENLEKSEDLSLIKNIIDFVICIKKKQYDISFQYSFTSIARSFLYALSDEEIWNAITSSAIAHTIVYQSLEPISQLLDSEDIYHILLRILDITNFYEKSITVGDIQKREIRIQKLLELAIHLTDSGYDIYQFKEYLTTLLEEGYSIRYSLNTNAADSVKIMTIHKSKGLEYPICYFTGLYKGFNILDIKDKFLYSSFYGFILPYFEEGISETFLKSLMKETYIEEEISEKIRLFYVATTRAKEKMIFLLPLQELEEGSESLISHIKRKKYRSFADILNSLHGDIQAQYQIVEPSLEMLTKEYLFPRNIEKRDFSSMEKLSVVELEEKEAFIEQKHFSKVSKKVITKEQAENMLFGTKVHEILEYLDFQNPEYSNIENRFIRNKVKSFLAHPLLKNIQSATIYKEYEFIYESNQAIYHGIIDCMLEYENYIDIIDYKLKNIAEEAYISQLKGYQNYIENITGKKVNLYLYSIIDSQIQQIV